jgi:hypothetical protein
LEPWPDVASWESDNRLCVKVKFVVVEELVVRCYGFRVHAKVQHGRRLG